MKTSINPTFDAFRLHDEQGVPLTVALACGVQRNVFVNLAAFGVDALAAGWSLDKLLRTLESACADNGRHFDRKEYSTKLSYLISAHKGDYTAAKLFITKRAHP